MNGLNRNLEEIIGMGNEFAAVEALWSQFEGVMGKGGEGVQEKKEEKETEGQEEVEVGDETSRVERVATG